MIECDNNDTMTNENSSSVCFIVKLIWKVIFMKLMKVQKRQERVRYCICVVKRKLSFLIVLIITISSHIMIQYIPLI